MRDRNIRDNRGMVWFFERATEVLELETRYDNAAAEYVLEQRTPGASPRIERFSDAASFRARLRTIEDDLKGRRWSQNGAPVILPDGWPDVTPRQ